MTRLEAALLDVSGFLDDHGVPYMVVGGFANLYWGVERFTRDLDLTVEIADDGLETFLERLRTRFHPAVEDALSFARQNHLVRLKTGTDVDVDLLIATLPYEVSAIERAIPIVVGESRVRMCTAEDLVIYKLASDRGQDALDVEGIIARQAGALDRAYLLPRVRELGLGLERPDLLPRLEQLLAKVDAEGDVHG